MAGKNGRIISRLSKAASQRRPFWKASGSRAERKEQKPPKKKKALSLVSLLARSEKPEAHKTFSQKIIKNTGFYIGYSRKRPDGQKGKIMLLVIRDQHKEYNRFEGVYALESFICNITAKAAGKNLKMKVNDNMNGFATFIFYQSNGIVYEFRNVPYSYGYITEAGIDQIIKAGK